jgi:uncharacterized membrane protein
MPTFERDAPTMPTTNSSGDQLSKHVAETIETVAAVQVHAQRHLTGHQRAIEIFTAALGRPRTLYLIIGFVAAWCGANLLIPRPFDRPPFFWLQGIMGLSAILMGSLILITQNRQSREAEQRAQLDLQVNLVAEQKIAKIIELIEELRRDLPDVRDRVDSAANAMTESVDASAVLSALEQTLEATSLSSDTTKE